MPAQDTEKTTTAAEVLAQYLNGPLALREVVARLTDAQLGVAATPGGWTIRHIVHHVVDGDDMWKMAIKAALGKGTTAIDFKW